MSNAPLESEAIIPQPQTKINKLPTDAWVTIWFKPRGAIRQIIDKNPEYGVILLATLSGIARYLDQASDRSLGDNLPLGWLLVTALIGGGLFGILSLYISGFIFQWTGKWFGGQATSEEVRTAMAWASIPDVLLLMMYVVIITLTGNQWFVSSSEITNSPLFLLLVIFLLPFGFFILLMRTFLSVKCLAEAHRFSAWKSLFTLITGSLIVFIPLAILLLPTMLMSGSLAK